MAPPGRNMLCLAARVEVVGEHNHREWESEVVLLDTQMRMRAIRTLSKATTGLTFPPLKGGCLAASTTSLYMSSCDGSFTRTVTHVTQKFDVVRFDLDGGDLVASHSGSTSCIYELVLAPNRLLICSTTRGILALDAETLEPRFETLVNETPPWKALPVGERHSSAYRGQVTPGPLALVDNEIVIAHYRSPITAIFSLDGKFQRMARFMGSSQIEWSAANNGVSCMYGVNGRLYSVPTEDQGFGFSVEVHMMAQHENLQLLQRYRPRDTTLIAQRGQRMLQAMCAFNGKLVLAAVDRWTTREGPNDGTGRYHDHRDVQVLALDGLCRVSRA